MPREGRAHAYADQGHDRMRSELEEDFFRRLIPGLLEEAGGGAVLDLGCGDGLTARLAGRRLRSYTGVDLSPGPSERGEMIRHDLREGLGPVGKTPFDLYLGTFGVASHLAPGELRRLLREIAEHARPGSIVALEALGVYSLEWPRLWGTRAGRRRTIAYRMAAEVSVHPWAPGELASLFARAGIEPVRAIDRTLQAGPKTGESGCWPGMPSLRGAMNDLLTGEAASDALTHPLPPLPAGRWAAAHQRLAARRRALIRCHRGTPAALARAIWALEPRSGDGLGHGVTMIGRVP